MPQAPRRAGARRDGVPAAGPGEDEAARDGPVDAPALGQRGLLGRREEAQRDLPDGACSSRSSRSSTRPTPASTSTRCKVVADGVNALRGPDRAIIVVTHYQRLLDYIVPDFVHVLSDGRIVQVGRQGAGAGAREARATAGSSAAAGGSADDDGTAGRDSCSRGSRPSSDRPRGRPAGGCRSARDKAAARLRRARLPDRPRRGVALHERRADRVAPRSARRRRSTVDVRGRCDTLPYGTGALPPRVRQRPLRRGALAASTACPTASAPARSAPRPHEHGDEVARRLRRRPPSSSRAPSPR